MHAQRQASYRPAGQEVHFVFSALTMWPSPQLVHDVPLPVAEYLPTSHGLQPVWLDSYSPGEQEVHVVFFALTM